MHVSKGDGMAKLWLVPIALAQVVKQDLQKIGLDVEVKGIPGSAYINRISTRGEPFDIAFLVWAPDYIDPYTYINELFDSRFIGGTNLARFDSSKYDRRLRGSARRRGHARYGAYGALDVRLARDAAPLVAVDYPNDAELVSKRVGCVVLRPTLDLTAACLK